MAHDPYLGEQGGMLAPIVGAGAVTIFGGFGAAIVKLFGMSRRLDLHHETLFGPPADQRDAGHGLLRRVTDVENTQEALKDSIDSLAAAIKASVEHRDNRHAEVLAEIRSLKDSTHGG